MIQKVALAALLIIPAMAAITACATLCWLAVDLEIERRKFYSARKASQ